MRQDWRPSAMLTALQQRAELLARLRTFMAERQILEVETPVLSHAATTDPALHSLCTAVERPDQIAAQRLYLNTSPEYAMKRLLAAGSGPIYQISKAFRDRELGQRHHPEFTMLEWYRPGFNQHQLMDEIEALLRFLKLTAPLRRSYAQVFAAEFGVDPHRGDNEQLRRHAGAAGYTGNDDDAAAVLDFLFARAAGAACRGAAPLLVYDFPVSQAALARVRQDSVPVAERFELFIGGMEIANGFHELTDAGEQRRRFAAENARRVQLGLPRHPADERLLAALAAGLPDCSGVALGVDRLMMVVYGYQEIAQVLAFTIDQA